MVERFDAALQPQSAATFDSAQAVCKKATAIFDGWFFDTIQPVTANCVYCSGSILWMVSMEIGLKNYSEILVK